MACPDPDTRNDDTRNDARTGGPRLQEASGLTGEELEAIAGLERRVVDHDGGRLKLEWGVLHQRPRTDVNDLLVWDGSVLAGFCGIYDFGSQPELAGAVDPAYRRRGIGTSLLGRALALVAGRGRRTVLLVAPRATDAGRRFAEAKGATFDHAEHHMELDGGRGEPRRQRTSPTEISIRPATDADRAAVAAILADGFGEGAFADDPDLGDLTFVVEHGTAVVGTLRLSIEAQTAGIYGFAVRSDMRGRGIGRAALYEACLEARRRGVGTVTLEVDVDNDHALGLYTSVGFERRTTEDYFRLTV